MILTLDKSHKTRPEKKTTFVNVKTKINFSKTFQSYLELLPIQLKENCSRIRQLKNDIKDSLASFGKSLAQKLLPI